MRRVARLERSIDLVKTQSSAHSSSIYLCLACRNRAAPFSTSAIRAAQVPYTEKIRNKIWGTDKPPGQANPYGEESVFDQTKKKQQEELKEMEAVERKRNVAPAADMTTYEQATTWGDDAGGRIPWVGGFGNWWKDNWDPEHRYLGFAPKSKMVMKDLDQITAAFYRALVETFACKQAGLPLTTPSTIAAWNRNHRVRISLTESGAELASEGPSLELIMQSFKPAVDETAEHEAPTESEEDVAADRSTVDPLNPESTAEPVEETSVHENPTESEEDVAADRSTINVAKTLKRNYGYEKFVKSVDPSWRQISLADPEIKFAVHKRVLRLTGIRIPDSAIQPSKTAGAFLSHLIAPPKPRKLAQALQDQRPLTSLQNVNISATRVTPIDKEKQVGRWKLIEQELTNRGLPVTGH
ncbi:uncharacterized protein LY89DRAFT_578754 [Mollisia scopiformis]|uniref:Large ribosomal subunit protein mL50 n=1 Tax=Mollisia scopiformis TaxID=149040 RepID=A0A194XJQ8_MOLSC|nr:uncharacterized protein LY89DRAFT_578754 [Mollisia scopiformis]KUJ20361.1 hypothetical protein LY89DRAFT_578754 [Mollisia scopiformis]